MRTGQDYAQSRVGERGDRNLGRMVSNQYEFDALAEAFEAGRDSQTDVMNTAKVIAAKLLACKDGENYGCGIKNGEVWRLANAILIAEGECPVHPNVNSPEVP